MAVIRCTAFSARFGVRQLAAAFENDSICMLFQDSLESGSKLPHSKG